MSKLLSQGGYGCVYHPGLFCDGSSIGDEYVSKMQIDAEWTEREILLGSRIVKINNYLWYFAPVVKYCNLNINVIKDKTLLKDCEIIKPGETDYKLMFIPYVEKQPFLYTLFKNYNSMVFLYLIEVTKQLLISIKKLTEQSVIHFDLKAENIILNTKNKYPIIIDFGISIDYAKVNSSNYSDYFYGYHPQYYVWPIEVHIICFLVNNRKLRTLTIDDLRTICNDIVIDNKRFDVFGTSFKEEYILKSIEYYKKYVGKKKLDIIKKLISTSWYTWDMYSIAIFNLQIFAIIFNKSFFYNKLLVKFFKLTMESIHYNPSKRPLVDDKISSISAIYLQNNLAENQQLSKYLNERIKNIDVEQLNF